MHTKILSAALIVSLFYLLTQLSKIIHFIIPAPIVGMIILLCLFNLVAGSNKYFEEGGGFILKNILLFFMPPLVCLPDSFQLIKDNQLLFLVFFGLASILFFFATACVVKWVFNFEQRRGLK
ncbi:CidA/LrgA family protein [Leeia sp. TBRC 13508]|uniref:CidA/LrgA family protein n=1 Tax=Leeia speluncae TaxID=2884804 RepID=A0ABS8D930_9NEIS|nr:CidA/LrgA family protein [Leeia speluncae]